MHFRINKKVNLLWRLIGINIILLVIGIININSGNEISTYAITYNVWFALNIIYQVSRSNYNIDTNAKDILLIYVICKVVIGLFFKPTAEQLLISFLFMLAESLWLIKFYLLYKKKEVKEGV